MRTVVAAILALTACASEMNTTTGSEDEVLPGEITQVGSSCPMMVQGATVSMRDAQGGVALVFTTQSGDVEELRARVEKMGEVHHSTNMMPMADAEVRVEDVVDGAQLVFIPADIEQVEMMRLHLQKAATELESGECPTEEIAIRSEPR